MQYLKIVCVTLLMVLCLPVQAQEKITGYVIDDQTGDSLGFVSVQYKDRRLTTMADHRGYFSIPKHLGGKLVFSAVGYKTRTVTVGQNTHRLLLSLKPDTKTLGEVTVKSKRQRYSRKNNPAVELMRKVIARKKQTDLTNRDYYQYTKYQKLTLALNDVKPDMLTNPKFSKYGWLTGQVEKCELTGKLILPASVDETVTQKVYRRTPHDEKEIVKGERSEGITHFFETGDMLNVVSKDAFCDVNIYDDQVRILRHPFTSPIGKSAISFYRYYIEDTLKIDRDSCIHVHFLPNNMQDFGFRGDLYILKDSSYQVKRCEMILPNRTDVNFVESLKMVQEFTRLPSGEWVLAVDDMVAELVLFDFVQKGVAIRTTRLSDYSFDEIPASLFKGREKKVIDPDARLQSDAYWQQQRRVELTESEAKMGDFMSGMQGEGWFKYVLWTMKLFSENFIETGKPSKIDIGPVFSTLSSNFIDGLRLRLSAQTTANLNRHLFLKGFVARGMKSNNNYYSAQVTWSLNKKKYLPDEFPRRNITFLSTYDVMAPSDKFLQTDKDNVFTSLRWVKNESMMFYNRQQLSFEREELWGLRSLLSLKTEKNEAAGNMPYFNFRTTELRAELEYTPGALYVNSKMRRLKVNREAPIMMLAHTFGLKGFLGGDYRYNYTEATLYKRLWLNSWGRIDCYLRGGVQWNQVPFPLLPMPAANMSYVRHFYTFNMLTSMEFLNDRFASADLRWDMQGKLLNRIPLVKKLKWRELVGVKMLWGALSDKNNPMSPANAGSTVLMPFPAESRIMNPKVPYWEISVGVGSILRFFEVEFVRSMNYNEAPHHHKNSVRFGFNMSF